MKFCSLSFLAIAMASMAFTQIELVSSDYFPADFEFQELRQYTSEVLLEDSERISQLENGPALLDLGCSKYAKRVYPTGDGDSLSIEVATVVDSRAAYSLLTLIGQAKTEQGPPGDAFISTPDQILFSQAREWVRIQSNAVPEEFLLRVATSVSNRIGLDRGKNPSLIAHLPKIGFDASSLRYYPSMNIYESFSGPGVKEYLKFSSDMQIAEAQYALGKGIGHLYLLDFPTPQVAEDFFSQLPFVNYVKKGENALYTKKVGPLVAILEGVLDAHAADQILGPLKYEYSIRWIYDRQNQARIIWGVPTQILGTVVKSLLFVGLLCIGSIVVGVGFAFLRFGIRGRGSRDASHGPDPNEIIRLRLR